MEATCGVAKAHVRFAREQPQVMFLTLVPSTVDAGADAVHVRMWSFVLREVAGVYGEHSAPKAAVVLWAFLHGITALKASRVFGALRPVRTFEFRLRM